MKKFTFFLITLFGIQVFSQINITKDNSFGNNGVFTADFNSAQTVLNSNLLVLPDNSILYIINSTGKNYILKLTAKGALDQNFANNGKLEFEENNFMNAVLQGNKIIIYLGPKPADFNNTYEDSKILRFNQNGTLDSTFGNNGILNEVTESANAQSLSVLVLADQSLVVSNSNSTYSKKYTINGQLETGFGNNGEIIYDYHFPLGQSSNGKIATCDISSLSSSVYSFFDINSLTTNKVLDLNNAGCHHYNGLALQNKTNISTRMTNNGIVYSVFEYKNYPLPDFSRLIVLKDEYLDSNFNGNGFVTSEDYEQFLDIGFSENQFFILNQKVNQKALNAYSSTGNPLKINNSRDFSLLSGDEIEMKDNFILVNSIIPDQNQNLIRVKIEKFLIVTEKLSTSNTSLKKIEVENPVKNFLNIKNAEDAENFELYSTEGRKISESKNYKSVNTANLPKGNYILKISMKNGDNFSKKLIKN
ncbi:T9SS type A sorting domain-containing protein [Kaistella jeonii]|nr:T9SS type A sorting domain-containing protein [Kaistella jeonii]